MTWRAPKNRLLDSIPRISGLLCLMWGPRICISNKFPDQISHSVVSDSLRPHESQHARPPCPSPAPGVHTGSRPLSQWCHPAVSPSVVPFSSCPQSLPASESFSNESTLRMRWPKYWSFSFSISQLSKWIIYMLYSLCIYYIVIKGIGWYLALDRGAWWATVHGITKESDMT